MFLVLVSLHTLLVCLKFTGVVVILLDLVGDENDYRVQHFLDCVDPVIQPFEWLAYKIKVPLQMAPALFLYTVILLDVVIETWMR